MAGEGDCLKEETHKDVVKYEVIKKYDGRQREMEAENILHCLRINWE